MTRPDAVAKLALTISYCMREEFVPRLVQHDQTKRMPQKYNGSFLRKHRKYSILWEMHSNNRCWLVFERPIGKSPPLHRFLLNHSECTPSSQESRCSSTEFYRKRFAASSGPSIISLRQREREREWTIARESTSNSSGYYLDDSKCRLCCRYSLGFSESPKYHHSQSRGAIIALTATQFTFQLHEHVLRGINTVKGETQFRHQHQGIRGEWFRGKKNRNSLSPCFYPKCNGSSKTYLVSVLSVVLSSEAKLPNIPVT